MPVDDEFTKPGGAMRDVLDDEFSALMDAKDPNRDAAYDLPTEAEIEAQQSGAAVVVVEEEDAELTAEEVAAAAEQKILGKFDTQQDLEKAYLEMESAYGSRSQELGEKRRVDEELADLKARMNLLTDIQTAKAAEPAPVTQEVVDWVETSVLENPLGTMEWVRTNQPALYDRAIGVWGQLDPFGASRYDTDLRIAAKDQEMNARLQASVAPQESARRANMLETAYEGALREHPELAPYAKDIETAATESPWLAKALGTAQTADEMKGIVQSLLYNARGRNAEAVNAATAGATEGQQAAAKTAKQRAAVTSPAAGGERGNQGPVASLKQRMLEANPVSIHDELERNRAKARGR